MVKTKAPAAPSHGVGALTQQRDPRSTGFHITGQQPEAEAGGLKHILGMQTPRECCRLPGCSCARLPRAQIAAGGHEGRLGPGF